VALLAALLIAMTCAGTARAASPTAVVDGPADGRTGVPVAFDGSASRPGDGGGLLSYAWSIDGDDVGVEHPWLSVSFAHAGRHVIALTVTDATGATATDQHVVDVTGADRPAASLAPLRTTVPTAVVTAPQLLLRPPADRLRRHRLRVEVRCRRTARCSGILRAVALVGRRHRPMLLARRPFAVHAGGPRVLHLRLDRAARRRLARHPAIRVTAYRGDRVRVASIWAASAYRVHVVRRGR
jgi:hypothetical protein